MFIRCPHGRFMMPATALPDDITLFFAGGQGKSGTTWVQLLLDAHPEISCGGEAHFFDMLAPAMQQAFLRYRHQLDDNNKLFHELPGFALPEQPHAFAALRGAVVTALLEQARGQEPRALGERTPANVEHMDLIWEIFPQARFIHVMRDPRDVAVSLWHHGKRIQEGGFAKQYGTIDKLAVHLCKSWASWMQRCEKLSAERPGQYLEVRYEDLLASGPVALSRMLEFLSIEPDPEAVTRCLKAASFEKLSGGRGHGEEDTSSHFRKGVSGDWHNHLKPETAHEIRALAAPQLERLGYSIN